MPYRRSSYVKFGDTLRTATTGKGNVVKKPKASLASGSPQGRTVIAPPNDGFLYLGQGEYWVGPFYITQTVVNGSPSGQYVLGTGAAGGLVEYPMFEDSP